MEKLKLGIIGTGLIWNNTHKHVLKKLQDRVEIIALTARNESTRIQLAEEYPDVACYDDYREIIKLDEVDAIVILTPISLNGSITLESLEAGKHVFVEKPMATTLEEAERIMKLESSSGRRVFVLEQMRYNQSLHRLKELLLSGRIGKVISYDRVAHWMMDADQNVGAGYGKTSWRIDPEFPLGSFLDGGIHKVTELSYLFGVPTSVYARGNNLREGYGEYDQVVMMITYPDGIIGTFSHSSYLNAKSNYFYIRGTEGTIRFTDKLIRIEGANAEEIVMEESDPNVIMWESCLNDLSGGRTTTYGSEGSYEDISILYAAVQSMKMGV